MGRYSGKTCRIASMMVLTLTFLLVEIIVGHIANSLALIADAFHMLSDTMALVVGLVAVKLARRGRSESNTYGGARAEVVGALINAVFLIALCFTIFVEAVERLAMREAIADVHLLLYVGAVGLAINLLGLCLFHDHAHGHTHGGVPHSHGHSHSNGHSHHHGASNGCPSHITHNAAEDNSKVSDLNSHSDHAKGDENQVRLLENDGYVDSGGALSPTEAKQVRSHQLNMRGVFLHVLGDALGSVAVMISAGLTMVARNYIYPCDPDFAQSLNSTGNASHGDCNNPDPAWVLCIDPILSLVLVAIILCTTIPLLKQTALVLMQMVPKHLTVSKMKEDIEQMEGVMNVHELHLWSLAGNKVIASLHIRTSSLDDYIRIVKKVKLYLHEEGIHSATIQPEFPNFLEEKGRHCMLECGPELGCHADTCCGSDSRSIEKAKCQAEDGIRKRNGSPRDAPV